MIFVPIRGQNGARTARARHKTHMSAVSSCMDAHFDALIEETDDDNNDDALSVSTDDLASLLIERLDREGTPILFDKTTADGS